MTVKVRTIGLLRSLFGRASSTSSCPRAAAVADLLAALAETFGEQVAAHFAEPETRPLTRRFASW